MESGKYSTKFKNLVANSATELWENICVLGNERKMMKINKIVYSEYGWLESAEAYTLDLVEGYMEIIEGESLVDDKPIITKVTISNGQFEQINTVLDKLEIDKFQEYYIFPGVCDGTQWSFTAYLASGKILETSGSNAWPEGFEEFIRLFKTVRGDRELCEEDD